jgi:uncharacterized membrane protein YedE/YeeE
MFFTVFSGFLFGAIMVYARLNRYNVISGAARLTDYTVPKAILTAMGFGMILLTVLIGLGLANYHIKPFVTGGLIFGGLLFGAGMAILGYCPGTLFVSLGEGSLDALWGIIGGVTGGVIFTLVLPVISGILGPDFGKISLFGLLGRQDFVFYLIVVAFGLLLVFISFSLNKKEKAVDLRWLYSGIMLAVLNAVVFLKATADRPIGASTSYPYVGDLITGLTDNDYFRKIKVPGHWEFLFLLGAMLAALLISLLKKEFRINLIPSLWEEYKGESDVKRIFWSVAGGFILVFGARMAGGCTSGHILSGGMQLALSSYVFALFVAIGLVITGKLFYRKKN